MEEKDYLEFIKELNSKKTMQEKTTLVNEILNKDIDLDLEMLAVSSVLDDLDDLDKLFESMLPSVEYYMRKSITYFNMIKNYTSLSVKDEDDLVENYNIQLEEILKCNEIVKRYYDAVNEIYNNKKIGIITELSESLKNIPSVEEIDKMTKSFEELFSEKNADNLDMLKGIVAFNDPSMKLLKDIVYEAIPKQTEQNIVEKSDKKEKKN